MEKFSNLKAELQVRTVVQHAWSAVEHALQYKSEIDIPSKLQRRLYRIAGLFELADEEFSAIRDERIRLRMEASQAIAEGRQNIPITSSSIEEFLGRYPKKTHIMNAAASAGFTVLERGFENSEHIALIYDICKKINIGFIDDLKNILHNTDLSILNTIYDGQNNESSEWEINFLFAICLILIDQIKDLVEPEFFLDHGWDEDVAQHTLSSVRRHSSKPREN